MSIKLKYDSLQNGKVGRQNVGAGSEITDEMKVFPFTVLLGTVIA